MDRSDRAINREQTSSNVCVLMSAESEDPSLCRFMAACVVAPRCTACLRVSALECAKSASGGKLP